VRGGGEGERGGRAGETSLPERLRRHLAERPWWPPGGRVVVALSGGLDSLVLLHLLRFTPAGGDVELAAAHFDHGMRPGSRGDARWVAGLCRAWRIPLHEGRAHVPPRSEAQARTLRYGFLDQVRRRETSSVVVTAHHADDQVETLLFRLLRGTGPEGLAGIPEWRAPGVGRPLLPFSRAELEGWAAAARLRPREDPTNRERTFARNRVRHELLPLLGSIHPGARNALERLTRLSGERNRALAHLLAPELEAVVLREGQGELVVDRDGFLARPSPVRTELLRLLLARLGVRLSEAGTEAAGTFMSSGVSGGRVELVGGVVLHREFDAFRLVREGSGDEGKELEPDAVPRWTGAAGEAGVPLSRGTAPGRGRLRLSARLWEVAWWPGREPGDAEDGSSGGTWTLLRLEAAVGPLRFRGRRPGDRVRLREGTRKLKRLTQELRVPRGTRDELPLLVDGEGTVLWIPGRWTSPALDPATGREPWTIGVRDAGDDT
jgi:tRNA(Ile)-lysidine synthase